MQVPLSGIDITDQEVQAVVAVLRSGTLSLGPAVEEFEDLVRQRVGCRHAVAVNSGTSALHLIVRALGIGDGDEVITTPFSFIASANCLLYERATPVFVDIHPQTYNIDVDRIEAEITPQTRAILPVDLFGQPADITTIRDIALRHGLAVIEDACEAIGSEFQDIPTGKLADAAAFAFYPNKQITTGEGGIIVTGNDDLASLCRSMRNQGRRHAQVWLSHERLGFNYRLSDLHAALGNVQMKRLNEIITRRQKLAASYNQRLTELESIVRPYIAPRVTKMSWQAYVVQVRDGIDRDRVMDYLIRHGVACRPYFAPIHLQPLYVRQFGYEPGAFPIAERIGQRTIALPFFNRMTGAQIEYVVEHLKQGCEQARRG